MKAKQSFGSSLHNQMRDELEKRGVKNDHESIRSSKPLHYFNGERLTPNRAAIEFFRLLDTKKKQTEE
jgi:hypothetical protein